MKKPSPLARSLGALLAAGFIATTGHAEPFIDLGVASTRVEADISGATSTVTSTESGLHLGAGVRRDLAKGGNIGVRIELDDVDSTLLVAVRALDYRYSISDRLAVSAFLGAARLDLATPAHGYYLGGGVQIKELVRGWDLSVDLRLGDKLARDNLLPSDPQGDRPDNFYDLTGVSVYLSRRF
jgi:opacity protein-like surface antigen